MSVPPDMCTKLIETYKWDSVEKSVALEGYIYIGTFFPLKTWKGFSNMAWISHHSIYNSPLSSKIIAKIKFVAVKALKKTFATHLHFIRSVLKKGDSLHFR